MHHSYTYKRIVTFFVLINLFCVSCDETINNKNVSCDGIDVSEFPEDLFTATQKKCGAIILHIIFFLYCIVAIAVVCSEYFLPAVMCICDDLHLSEDVAAATFMSVATSTPELFTNIIGIFMENDIGLGHVIGNAYFNMFFVSAIGGFAASQDISIKWWPVTRDCVIYVVTISVLTAIVWDGFIQIYESIILLFLCLIYFLIMFNDQKIMKFFSRMFRIIISNSQICKSETSETVTNNDIGKDEKITRKETLQDHDQPLILPPLIIHPSNGTIPKKKFVKTMEKIIFLPLRLAIKYTIPDVRLSRIRKYYPIVFVLCMAWIATSTYLATWMISVIGDTINMPDLIMGMVFMAASGSVVEAFSIYYKVKSGECNIGLSNSLGCNTLDVTVCLALPWFIKCIISIISSCRISSSNIIIKSVTFRLNCILLVISIVILFITFYLNEFKLNKKIGRICIVIYLIILVIALSIERTSKNTV